MSERAGVPVQALIGRTDILKSLVPAEFADSRFGLETIRDILAELEKPGRDPRPEFKTAVFKDGVHAMSDLEPGMVLEGVVTNVANFGAFVDIGVHQDGLVHVSQLADGFVKDPYAVVKAGQIVKVRVLEVDLPRKRIGLTMRSGAAAPRPQGEQAPRAQAPPRPQGPPVRGGAQAPQPARPPRPQAPPPQPAAKTAFAAAFEKLKKS
jgi:uncharacterized protein